MKRRPYELEFSATAEGHLATLAAGDRKKVLDAVQRQLTHEPTVVTRNRKRMDPDKRMYVAPWELRVGHLRVYYAVLEEAAAKVVVVAVGVKERDRLRLGHEDVTA